MDDKIVEELGGVLDGTSKRRCFAWTVEDFVLVRWYPQCGDMAESLYVGSQMICYSPGLVRLKTLLVALGLL